MGKMELSNKWRGGRRFKQGYIEIKVRPASKTDDGYKAEHILIVERVLGKRLPVGAVVHHVNGDGTDNRNENLIACNDQAYHRLLHRREDAYRACGNASWRKCKYCKQYDTPGNLKIDKKVGSAAYHQKCQNVFTRMNRRSALGSFL
jgi:hypothetical protein